MGRAGESAVVCQLLPLDGLISVRGVEVGPANQLVKVIILPSICAIFVKLAT